MRLELWESGLQGYMKQKKEKIIYKPVNGAISHLLNMKVV